MHTWILAGLISSFIFILPLSAQEPAKDTISEIVVVEGVGPSPEEAIKDAFRKAVLQVGGSVIEVDPIIRTTGLDRNPCVFLSRKRLCFWGFTKEGVYAKEEAIV